MSKGEVPQKIEQSAGERMSEEIGARLRSRATLLHVLSDEERRVEAALSMIAPHNKYGIRFWDGFIGLSSLNQDGQGKFLDEDGKDIEGHKLKAPGAILSHIFEAKRRHVWVLRDFAVYLKDPTILRALRSLVKVLQTPKVVEETVEGKKVRFLAAQVVVVLTPEAMPPPELRDLAVVIRWPLPDRVEVGQILDGVLEYVPDDKRATAVGPNGAREAVIEAAIGLSAEGAKVSFQKSLVTQQGKIVPTVVAEDKRRIVSSAPGLTWYDPDPRGMDAIGGLDAVKAWLAKRKKAFSAKARDFGLPRPKGILCVGPPGTGKSLLCKAVAAAWRLPLIRLDLAGMKAGVVGSSEANIRRALAIIEAVDNCIVWVDEIEKSIAPAGSLDGGVSGDQLGTLLTWMNDRKGGAFVVATANRIDQLPPELVRKGRFNEVFCVDLPGLSDRQEIVRVSIKKFGRDPDKFRVDEVASACEGFTGAEIDAVVEEALFTAFDAERELLTEDVLLAAKDTTPQSKSAEAEIKALRKWVEGRGKFASSPEKSAPVAGSGGISVVDFT